MSTFNGHVTWCDHRESGETHDPELPYCMKQIHGVRLFTLDGAEFPPQIWVYATNSAHVCALTTGKRPADDHLYDGVELTTEHQVGDDWVEQKMRMTSDAARSLAATLIRAADIQQGLTR